MSLSRLRSLIPILALALVFVWSVWHVAGTRRAVAPDGKIVIRLGHWLLHAGMRESFDEAIADYKKIRPDVLIEQIAVPVRSYPAWLRTRLVGDTAPDITGMMGVNAETAGRYFLPLDPWLDQPNPHNAGTPLEGLPWRQTSADGLDSMRRSYAPVTGEIFGFNLQINTLRLYYNRALLRAVTGSDEPPTDFAAFRALQEKVAAYNRDRGTRIVPVASCGPYAQMLFNELIPTQTQRLAVELSPTRNLVYPPTDLAIAFLRGELGYDTPAIRSGLNLLRDVTALMPPGFTQLQRDDALFAYLQQQAVMFYAGSWDYGVLVRDGPFPTGLVRLPTPGRDHPIYGQNVLGPVSEAADRAEAALGVVRNSRHPEAAVDFLRFLTSRAVAENFTRNSHRISAIVGTPPPPDAPGLASVPKGEVQGFPVDFFNLPGGNASNLFQRNLHLALGPKGDVDAFIRAIEASLPAALRRDLGQHLVARRREIHRLDAQLALEFTRPGSAEGAWEIFAEALHVRQTDRLPARSLQ